MINVAAPTEAGDRGAGACEHGTTAPLMLVRLCVVQATQSVASGTSGSLGGPTKVPNATRCQGPRARRSGVTSAADAKSISHREVMQDTLLDTEDFQEYCVRWLRVQIIVYAVEKTVYDEAK